MNDPSSPSRATDTGQDLRRHSPSFTRNIEPICAVLGRTLKTGTVLEIGSGSGQHIAHFRKAFPSITWIASEPDPASRASCDAWAGPNAPPTRNLNAAGNWAAEVTDLAPIAAILSCNVIHISPIAVLNGIISGARETLAPGGLLIFYGPFAQNGKLSDGNAAFDQSLKSRDPNWGVRDMVEIQDCAKGFTMSAPIAMPATNHILIFTRS